VAAELEENGRKKVLRCRKYVSIELPRSISRGHVKQHPHLLWRTGRKSTGYTGEPRRAGDSRKANVNGTKYDREGKEIKELEREKRNRPWYKTMVMERGCTSRTTIWSG
jgi:hypothetical protein